LNILVDTSVVSQTRKGTPMPGVVRWLQRQSVDSLYLSAISVHEIRQGIELAPAGAKRNALEIWLQDFVLRVFADRILSVDGVVADASGRLVALTNKKGHTAELADALIAATAKVHGLKVATLNRKHFERLGVELVEF
jgi:predicted nucleic acid-binding protein